MTNGVFEHMSIDAYHADKEYLSATGLKKAKRSLKDFYLYQQGFYDSERKSCLDFGNAAELALLDTDSFEREVAVFNPANRPELNKTFKSAKNRTWRDEIMSSGKYIINHDGKESFRVIEEILRSCYADAVIQKLIKNIEYQYSIFWQDVETGLKLKTRPDICKSRKNIIVDAKTANDGSPQAFSRDMAKYDYPFQAVMQMDGCISSGFMSRVDNYFWLVLEKQPPFSATLYEFDQEDIKYCKDEYEYVKKITKEAIDKNIYPSYSQQADNKYGILTARLPLWYRSI